ncbi:nitroreductase family protein [Saccharibacillus alkalitolerans]|uniref:Nitroreductase family protein n=1 Tax=Saccharibacillus alkalitolerans TaxID=2705290 RepID=A0ABX0FCI5_9BACL|nr:nitroreductase family protein [Saccharibacillus alkalitolerans]NGZ77298.1 nitroreductase family protein [Saccharibacillus alkalitolerans]
MSSVQKVQDFMEVIKSRRSVRYYDPSVKISREEMTQMLEESVLAPSSVNMQPWRFVVIESEEAKAKLLPLAKFNGHQVETSSAVVAVFGDLKFTDFAEEIFGKAVELGYMPQDVKEQQLAAYLPLFDAMPVEMKRDSVLIDAGLVSMQFMLVARAHGYDTNPIGGYEKDKVAEAFGIDPERHVPVMLISIGKAAKPGHSSARLDIARTTEWR